jgi:hypothetical protein
MNGIGSTDGILFIGYYAYCGLRNLPLVMDLIILQAAVAQTPTETGVGSWVEQHALTVLSIVSIGSIEEYLSKPV